MVYRSVAAATQLIEIQKATDEVVLSLSGDQSQSLQSNDKLQVNSFTSPNLTFLYVNENPEVLSFGANPHFLQAVRYGLDYDGLVKVAGAGAAQAPGVVPPQFLGALPAVVGGPPRRGQSQEPSCRPPASPTRPSSWTIRPAPPASPKPWRPRSRPAWARSASPSPSTVNRAAIATPNYRGGKNPMGLFGWAPDYPDPNDYLPFLPGQLVGKRAGWLPEADSDAGRDGQQGRFDRRQHQPRRSSSATFRTSSIRKARSFRC